MAAAVGSAAPCGACKFLRRKCAPDCIFAPYFCCDQGQARFAAMHKVFGASNVSKLLKHLPVSDRGEAVITVVYEAQARIRDPVYGCVAHILALQQQVTYLQEQLMQLKTQVLSNNQMQAPCLENQWLLGNCTSFPGNQTVPYSYPLLSRQRSPESVGQLSNAMALHLRRDDDDERYLLVDEHKPRSRKRSLDDMSMNELQELVFNMMRN